MDAMTLMNARHSVRQYEDKPIPAEILAELKQECKFRPRSRTCTEI